MSAMNHLAVSATPSLPPVRTIEMHHPLAWMEAGVHDVARATTPSLLHGIAFSLGGLLILLVGWNRFAVLAGAFSGFLLVAPTLATGLYEISRRLSRGEQPTLRQAVWCGWRRGGMASLRFGLLLAAVGTLWVMFSALVLLAMTGMPLDGLRAFFATSVLKTADLGARGHLFLMWLAAGGLLASVVFAISAISVPLLLDRRVSLRQAMLTSVCAVGRNPLPMTLWAFIILIVSLIGLFTLVGLAVLLPVLGHATWHAYTDLVDASAFEPRDSSSAETE